MRAPPRNLRRGVFGSFGRGISFQLWGILWCPYWFTEMYGDVLQKSSLHMFESFFLNGEVHPPPLRNRGKLIPLNLSSFSGWSPHLLWTSRHLPVASVTWRYGETGEACILIPQNGHLQAYCWRAWTLVAERNRQAWWLPSGEGKDPKK